MQEDRFWERVRKSDGCWEWTGYVTRYGYGEMWVGKHYLSRDYEFAHRMSWRLHYGSIPEDTPCVLHRCDNRRCVRPDHLFLGTKRDNTLDMMAKGRRAHRPNTVVTEEQVRQIKERLAAGVAVREIARCFPLSRAAVQNIKHGRTWPEV